MNVPVQVIDPNTEQPVQGDLDTQLFQSAQTAKTLGAAPQGGWFPWYYAGANGIRVYKMMPVSLLPAPASVQTALDGLATDLVGKAAKNHRHAIGDTDLLQQALDGKHPKITPGEPIADPGALSLLTLSTTVKQVLDLLRNQSLLKR